VAGYWREPPSVLVILTTGRPSYRQAADSLRLNIARWEPAAARVDLLVNFDPAYQPAGPAEFCEPACAPLTDGGRVFFAGPDFIRRARWLEPPEKKALASISPVAGYGQKKNACLLFAARHGYDIALFWDDDEYALHIEQENGTRHWASTDVIGAHLRADADVTFGFWTGYVSPIPDSFFTNVSEETRRALTRALGPVTDVVNEATFSDRSATYYVAPPGARHRTAEIREDRGGKWVSGGNLALRLPAVAAGRLPAFYTPAGSRGDDSVFSARLQDATVFSVPAGIFHDAFGTLAHADLRDPHLLPARSTPRRDQATRFAGVVRGWLAYAPVLTILRHAGHAAGMIRDSAVRLEECDAGLLAYFGTAWAWPPPSQLLTHYLTAAGRELADYERTQCVWRTLCGGP
jgi:hypothetical protein